MIYHKSKQAGFIEHGEANIDKIMHNGECVFNQGFDSEASGTDSVTLNGTIGKDLMDWSITGNTVQDGTPSPDNIVSVLGVGDKTEASRTSVRVIGVESGTNYAYFNIADIPTAKVNDIIGIVVNNTTYDLMVKKITSNYVYVENKVV